MGSHGAAAMTGAVLGARTARACDGCLRRRARWHCAADDAFLCQACDASVHSANPLARRHHRVRLPSSSAPSPPRYADEPAWLHGLKRRPRTPRSKLGTKQEPSAVAAAAAASAVPDLEAEDSGIGGGNDHEVDDDDDLLYRVPVFDPMLAELCNPVAEEGEEQEQKPLALMPPAQPSPEFASASASGDADGIAGFDVPDADLASFAADMESLLMGDGGFDDLGFLNDEKPQVNVDLDMDVEATAPAIVCLGEGAQEMEDRKKKADKILKLDYEAVISSWVRDGSSPWFHGERPQLDPGEPWPDFRAASRVAGAAVTAVTGGEREARVSRYREKRRTRLFAKKIRYEVRKLNAEKRPRMKGRFVKRTSFALPPPPQVPMMLAAPPVGHGRFRF